MHLPVARRGVRTVHERVRTESVRTVRARTQCARTQCARVLSVPVIPSACPYCQALAVFPGLSRIPRP